MRKPLRKTQIKAGVEFAKREVGDSMIRRKKGQELVRRQKWNSLAEKWRKAADEQPDWDPSTQTPAGTAAKGEATKYGLEEGEAEFTYLKLNIFILF